VPGGDRVLGLQLSRAQRSTIRFGHRQKQQLQLQQLQLHKRGGGGGGGGRGGGGEGEGEGRARESEDEPAKWRLVPEVTSVPPAAQQRVDGDAAPEEKPVVSGHCLSPEGGVSARAMGFSWAFLFLFTFSFQRTLA